MLVKLVQDTTASACKVSSRYASACKVNQGTPASAFNSFAARRDLSRIYRSLLNATIVEI